jgi:hypothetical protein
MKDIFLVAILFQSMIATAQMPESPQVAPVSPMRAFYKSKITPASATDKITPQKWDALFGIVDSQKADIGRLASKVDTGLIAATQVYYVDRQYTNPATRAVQLSKARVGDPSRPFPTPWAARNAFIRGGLSHATILIAPSNIYREDDYDDISENIAKNVDGTSYNLGIALSYHNLHYIFWGSELNFPLVSFDFSNAQAANGGHRTSFRGSGTRYLGDCSNPQADIIFQVDSLITLPLTYPNRAHNTQIGTFDLGLKSLKIGRLATGDSKILLGDKWRLLGNPNKVESIHYSVERWDIGSKYTDNRIPYSSNGGIYVNRMVNKTLTFDVKQLNMSGADVGIAWLGHWSGSSGSGIHNSVVTLNYGSVRGEGYVGGSPGYCGIVMGGINTNSKFTVNVENLTSDRPALIYAYGQSSNCEYNVNIKKAEIRNPTVAESCIFSGGVGVKTTITGDYTFETGKGRHFACGSRGGCHFHMRLHGFKPRWRDTTDNG